MSIQNQKPIIEFRAKIRRVCVWSSCYSLIKIPKKLSERVPNEIVVPRDKKAWYKREIRKGMPKVRVIMENGKRGRLEREAVIKKKSKGLFIQMPLSYEYHHFKDQTIDVKILIP